MIDFFNTRYLDKLIEIPDFIETLHQMEFQVTDIVHNDLYRHMNDKGLFDYNYIQRGTRGGNNPSKTNLVFLTWLMIAVDLKDFGFKIDQLKKVKQYLFKEFDLLENIDFPTDKESLLNKLDKYEFKNDDIKNELTKKISSGKFLNGIKDKSISCMFFTLYKMIATGRDIQLHIDSSGQAIFIDEFELSDEDLQKLSFEKRIILPLKNYLIFFIGEYAPLEYLTRSKILSEREAVLLDEFRRNDIISLTVKFHKGEAHVMEIKKHKKIEIQARLSEVILKGGYEDIIIKTQNGTIHYSEQIKKVKL